MPLSLRFERADAALDDVFHVNEIALLLAVFENTRTLAGLHLFARVINHARGHAFVRLAWSVNIEVTQSDNDPVRESFAARRARLSMIALEKA